MGSAWSTAIGQIDAYVQSYLALKHAVRTKTANRDELPELQDGRAWFNGREFLSAIIERFDSVLAMSAERPWRKNKNRWSWRAKTPRTSARNSSLEVTLERNFPVAIPERLVCQMAVSAGPLPGGPRSAIDLVYKQDDDEYDCVELKMPDCGQEASQPPLAAAVELMKYAAAYICTRRFVATHGISIGRDQYILHAKRVGFRVLGPQEMYRIHPPKPEPYALAWFERELANGLELLGREFGCNMSFAFHAFHAGFKWTATTKASEAQLALLRDAWTRQKRVYGMQ